MEDIKKACTQNINQFSHKMGISAPQLKIKKSSIINSYFTPSNTILITTGLIKVLPLNEIEFCLAHEIGHALIHQKLSNQQKLDLHNNLLKESRRVIKCQLKKFRRDTVITVFLGLALPLIIIILVWSLLSSPLIIILIMIIIMSSTPFFYKERIKNIVNSSQTVALKLLTPTQRSWFFKNEFKADQIGVQLTNPKIAINTFNHLKKLTNASYSIYNKSLKSTKLTLHPSFQKRIERIKKYPNS